MPGLSRPYHAMSQGGNYERTICKGQSHAKTPLALVPTHCTKNIEIAWRISNMKVGRTDHLRRHVRRPDSFPRQHTKSACPADLVWYVSRFAASRKITRVWCKQERECPAFRGQLLCRRTSASYPKCIIGLPTGHNKVAKIASRIAIILKACGILNLEQNSPEPSRHQGHRQEPRSNEGRSLLQS